MNAIITQEPGAVAMSRPGELATTSEAGMLLNIIAKASENPNVDVNKLSALLDMQERVLAKEAEGAFTRALVQLNTDKLRVKKNGTVDLGTGKGSYKFARWEDMDAVIRPLLQREGFTLSFDTTPKEGGGITVTGTLLHSSGHNRKASIPLALDTGAGRNNLQAMGSTLAYGKRYVTEMLLNIVREDEDDDAVRGGTLFITHEQAQQIEDLLTETKADRTGFMRHFAVNSILEMTVENFAPAVNMLNAKKSKQAKAT